MMDHSNQGYLSRRSNAQLEHFLLMLLKTGAWDNYDHVIPEIMQLFQRRRSIPNQAIQNVWNRKQ